MTVSSNGRGNKVAEVTATAIATATVTVAATTARTKTAVVSGGGNSKGHRHTQQSNHFGSGRNGIGGDSNGGYGCDNNQLQAEMVMAVLVMATAATTPALCHLNSTPFFSEGLPRVSDI